MAKRLRYSRWRRLPGVYRFGDDKPPDPKREPERLTLYLPRGLLDAAEAMSLRAGAENVQQYCERLLIRALEGEQAREQVEELEARRGPLEGLDAIANDPEYLVEWNCAPHPGRSRGPEVSDRPAELPAPAPQPLPAPTDEEDPFVSEPSPAATVVLRHAAVVGDDPSGFLASLRRGEAVGADAARELLQALIDLEVESRDARRIDRRLAYALHRLAFEGQVLLTDAWHGASADAATVDVLRIVQEGVDRVLSGEDIRYFPQGS